MPSADAAEALEILGDTAESSSSAPISRRTRRQRLVGWALVATFVVPIIIAAVKTLLDAL